MTERRLVSVTLLASIVLGAAVACSKGGDTTCDKYRSMGGGDKVAAVKKMMQDRGDTVTPLRIDATRLSVTGYCFSHAGSDRISSVYSG